GDFDEHIQKLRTLGAETSEVRKSSDLEGLDALIIPGGESTTNAILEAALIELHTLIRPYPHTPIFDAIKIKATHGLPIWGTCMGSIVLAKDIEGSAQGRIGLMDISLRRNAF